MLLVLRASVSNYPPTLNQANLLAQKGLRVGIINLWGNNSDQNKLDSAVVHWQVHRQWNSKTDKIPLIANRWFNWIKFYNTCQRVMFWNKPKVVIGYDIHGCMHLWPRSKVHHTIYHFHEFPEKEKGMGIGPWLSMLQVSRNSRKTDFVVFSDIHRADLFVKKARLTSLPKIVMNCPTTMNSIPVSNLSKILSEMGLPKSHVVCYLGSIGDDKGLIEAARSMTYWPENAVFVLIGPYAPKVKENILINARLSNASERVFFLGPKPHSEALMLAAGGDVGLSLIQSNTKNWLYSAGALNKRFEYMALGLPQVTNKGPGVADIIEKNDCGVCVDPRSPEQIGQTILNLLKNPERRYTMSINARSSHLNEFNYEKQFSEVEGMIESFCHNTT